MTQARTIRNRETDSPQGTKTVVVLFWRNSPQPKITPIATAADGSILAEAVPVRSANGLRGFVVRLRAQGCAIPRFRDSENVYPSLAACEDAYWQDCEARQFRETEIIEWGHWQESAVLVAAE